MLALWVQGRARGDATIFRDAEVIQSPVFQKDGLLIIVFDEADTLELTAGGGHVAAVIVSSLGKRGYKSIAFYQHQSVLRLTLGRARRDDPARRRRDSPSHVGVLQCSVNLSRRRCGVVPDWIDIHGASVV
jgi:hypothetical protein